MVIGRRSGGVVVVLVFFHHGGLYGNSKYIYIYIFYFWLSVNACFSLIFCGT